MTPRRQQILDIAAGLFAARGFHGVSVAELGSACGISGPALYKHFESKDAMLAEMLVTISETLLAEGRTRVADAEGPREALEALVEWHIRFAIDHRALIVVHNRDWSSLPDEARERVRALQRAYVDVWATEVRRLDPRLSTEASRTRAHVLFGLLNSTPHSGRLPDPQLHEVLREMAHGALGLDR
ncbi:TetR/AcrR family transcriptional regulator [Nocardioides sp. SYSU D00065]|uniref:SACE_7040 family transcriptional regulator n=1 Tax=Nocardioides sp. SYSU D00065 TaxID=2817378 RepID=UPI001B32CA35|nr:TetR/AcrR family transcriptional regulator [Nocardioides sp. SYSU D00065]